MMSKIAVVCGAGIGDALLMQIGARHLTALGHSVTTFTKYLKELSDWFPEGNFSSEFTADFDAIVLQHDNTPRAKTIHAMSKPVYTLYPLHRISKHGPLRPGFDFVFDPNLCMAENISLAMQTLFPGIEADTSNGITPPPHLIQNRYPQRVTIHTTSSSPEKNWPHTSFLRLRDQLEKNGWDPIFLPQFPTLSELAAYIYESGYHIGNDSGPGHLASNLGIPTVIVGPSKQHLNLWRPGWCRGEIAHPPAWVTHFKLTRNSWMHFISPSHVFKRFKKLTYIK